MTLRLGVYGHGPQSRRYLDPKNWPDGVEVVQLERDETVPILDGAIVASAPAFRLAMLKRVRPRLAILCEKPMGLAPASGEELMRARLGKVLVAHTHLWSRDFLRLNKSPSAAVKWRGPERGDGSCPAMLDWGPHAWSMAIALGTERVTTGKGDRSGNLVISGQDEYDGSWSPEYSPMRAMLESFASLIDGGYDWRAEPDFALDVHRRCFRP